MSIIEKIKNALGEELGHFTKLDEILSNWNEPHRFGLQGRKKKIEKVSKKFYRFVDFV